MCPKYSLVIDGPAIPKGRPRVVNGKAYTPKRTKQYEKLVGWIAKSKGYKKPLKGPVAVSIHFFFAKKPRVDLDNLGKCTIDALNGIAWVDDKQVGRTNSKGEGGLTLKLTENMGKSWTEITWWSVE